MALLSIEVFVVAPARFRDAMAAEVQPGEFGEVTYHSIPGVGFFLSAVILVALAVWQVVLAIRPPPALDEPFDTAVEDGVPPG